jgi:hypothetical protein
MTVACSRASFADRGGLLGEPMVTITSLVESAACNVNFFDDHATR